MKTSYMMQFLKWINFQYFSWKLKDYLNHLNDIVFLSSEIGVYRHLSFFFFCYSDDHLSSYHISHNLSIHFLLPGNLPDYCSYHVFWVFKRKLSTSFSVNCPYVSLCFMTSSSWPKSNVGLISRLKISAHNTYLAHVKLSIRLGLVGPCRWWA